MGAAPLSPSPVERARGTTVGLETAAGFSFPSASAWFSTLAGRDNLWTSVDEIYPFQLVFRDELQRLLNSDRTGSSRNKDRSSAGQAQQGCELETPHRPQSSGCNGVSLILSVPYVILTQNKIGA
jgi:hypothetical protein